MRYYTYMKNIFRSIASRISVWTGTATVFLGAIVIVLVWASTGPLFQFSDTWQLVINTGTTIITFLMVFLIQNTQNRDGKAVQLKLDELIRATKGARSQYVGLEDLSDADLDALDKEFKLISQNPAAIRAMAKLHEKIAAEHTRRGLSQAGASVLHMLHRSENAPTNQPPTAPPR
jgi:low affinity Fe/Cu permease